MPYYLYRSIRRQEYTTFRSYFGIKIDFEKLKEDAPLPCIVFWLQQHFVVVYKTPKNQFSSIVSGHQLLLFLLPIPKKRQRMLLILNFIDGFP
jgi:hypothetical protein